MLKITGILLLFFVSIEAMASRAIDALKPEFNESYEIPELYREMGVVQRKAFVKEGRFLFDSRFSMDFSDGPYTMYAVEVNPGYALGNDWELYANLVPFFISNPRNIVDQISSLRLEDGSQATVDFSLPRFQWGAELVWTPGYGKESILGSFIVRNDTLLKIGAAMTHYEGGTGLKFSGGIGKSYYLTRFLSYRFLATGAMAQTILNGAKSFGFVAYLQLGMVLYL